MSIADGKAHPERSMFQLVKSADSWMTATEEIGSEHPLQSWIWGSFKERWGWEAFPLVLKIAEKSSDAPASAAAMILKRKVPKSPFSILYVPKGPLLDYKNPALRRVVLFELESIARQENAIFIKIDPDVVSEWGLDEDRRSPTGVKFTEELTSRGWRYSEDQIQFRNTVVLDLNRDEDELLASFKQKTRYNIRLAGRRDIVVRLGTDADFPGIVQMYEETAIRDDFVIRPASYYLDAWKSFYKAGVAQPFIAEFEGSPIAAIIIVLGTDKAYYLYGASTQIERKRMPNHLLQWEAIKWARARGCRGYDFWGAPDEFMESDPLWGVWQFKRGFSGQVVKHIGAWDYAAKPFWYRLYTGLMPKYLEMLKSRR